MYIEMVRRLDCSRKMMQDYIFFSFFFNLLAEGTMKEMQCRELKIDPEDHFTRLIKTTEFNTIGSITLKEITHEMS